jgi:hypothetical protein
MISLTLATAAGVSTTGALEVAGALTTSTGDVSTFGVVTAVAMV